MAISDTITSMYDNTSNAYDMLSNGTDLTGINKNLENLSSTIFEAFLEALRNPDTLFTNLPKKSGNGTQITLNDTAYSPMRITLGSSALSQDGTPTPDNPQDIHTISGSNSVVVEGKNLFNKDNISTNFSWNFNASAVLNSDKSVTITANSNNQAHYMVILPVYHYEVGKTYTISVKNNNSAGVGYLHMFYSSWQTQYGNGSKTSITFTVQEGDKTDLGIGIYLNTNAVVTFYDFQIEEGPTATEYVPYQEPQTAPINLGEYELGTIGNYSNEFVRSDEENLLNVENNTTTLNNVYLTEFNTNLTITSDMVGKKYSLSFNSTISNLSTSSSYMQSSIGYGISWIESAIKSTNYSSVANGNYQIKIENFEIPQQAVGKKIFIRPVAFGSQSSCSCSYSNIMLNKGTTALSYVPYEKGWYYKEGIGKVVLDGTETGWFKSSTTNLNRFGYPRSNATKPILIGANNCICNYFTTTDNLYTNYPDLYLGSGNANLYVDYSAYDTTSADDFKTWLTTHNLILYYVLETPTYTQITGELAEQLEQVYRGMLSYDGTTNISQVNNDLPFDLVGSAIQKL